MRIAIIDDELNALFAFLEDIIGEEDVEYKFYSDNLNSLYSSVAKGTVDGVFLDVNMPRINGIELANKLINLDPTLKVVFITGLSVSEADLPDNVRTHTVGFLYKPYDKKILARYLENIREKKRILHAKMFNTFDCFIDGKRMEFSSSKSKELFALLLAYNGKSLTMYDAISQLWPDIDLKKSKILYRDAVWRLRKKLEEFGVPCVQWERARLSLDKSLISCDFWDYILTGNGEYSGEFCKNYDWSVNYLARLDAAGREIQISHDKTENG